MTHKLAWILSTSHDPDARDGELALDLAEQLNQFQQDEPRLLSLLAATYAELGRFDEALVTVDKAIALTTGDDQVRSQLVKCRTLYQHQKPLR